MFTKLAMAAAAALTISHSPVSGSHHVLPSALPETVHGYIQKVTSRKVADRFTGPIELAATRHQLPPLLVAKVVHRESDFDPLCVSGDCIGLMQVNPALWARRGESMYRVADNLEAGCRLLHYLHRRFKTWPRTLTAYNYGENHVVTRTVGNSRYAYLVLVGR